METKKVLGIIFSIIFVLAFGFALTWGIINFNKVKEGMSGTGVYTQEDVHNAYEDGYNTALSDKEGYDKLINSYRDTITTQSDQISQLKSDIAVLNNTNKDYKTQVSNLTAQRETLEEQVAILNSVKTNNEATITGLNKQIAELNDQVIALQGDKTKNEAQIGVLNNQIANLQTLNAQLQNTNELNLQTITTLNNQIASLTTQINEMTYQMQTNSTTVTALNNKITELQNSINYYEQYIANLENGEQVVATFEFAGSVYNIQIVNKNDVVTVTTPTSTAYVIFNGWTVNGESIDLSTYQVTANTKFVADVTYKYEVNFVVEGENYNNQIVVKDSKASMPADPTKAGYVFDCWTLDGTTEVDAANYNITQNTTFVAKFSKLYSVIFKYEDTTISTQTVKNGNNAQAVEVNNTPYKVFNGWKINNAIIDISTYKIVADTVFIADITYKYDVTFVVDEDVHNSQIVEKNGYAEIPAAPYKEGFEFDGWMVDGQIINVATKAITENITYTAKFTKLYTVKFEVDGVFVNQQSVRSGSYAQLPANPEKANYQFAYWTLNGSEVSVSNYGITNDLTFVAYFISQNIPKGAYVFTMDFKCFDTVYEEEYTRNGLNLIVQIDGDGDILGFDELILKEQDYDVQVSLMSNNEIKVFVLSSGTYDNNYYDIVLHYENEIWTYELLGSEHYGQTIEIVNFNSKFFTVREYQGALGDPFGYYYYRVALPDMWGTVLEGAFIRSDDGKVGMFVEYGDSTIIKSYVYERHDDEEWTEVSVVHGYVYNETTYTIEFNWWYGLEVCEIRSSDGEVWNSWDYSIDSYSEKIYLGW